MSLKRSLLGVFRRRNGSSKPTEADRALERLVSRRVGNSGGRPARTFHCHFGGITVAGGGAVRGGASLDYLAREGDYADRTDIEHVAGDSEALRHALEAIEAAAKVRSGPTAERVAVTAVFELPAAFDEGARREVAERIVQDWEDRGHLAVAAVHGRDLVQPHVHLAVTARPVERGMARGVEGLAPGWTVDRSKRLMVGKAAVQAERGRVAGIVNQVAMERGITTPDFHPGRLRDTGIDRRPERRRHVRNWAAKDAEAAWRAVDWALVDQAHVRHEAERQAAMERRRAREKEKAERLKARGLVRKAAWQEVADDAAELASEAYELKKQVNQLTSRQTELLRDMHELAGIALPDLQTAEGQAHAWKTTRRLLAEAKQARQAAQKAQDVPQHLQPAPSPAKPSAGVSAPASRPATATPLHIDPATPTAAQNDAVRHLDDHQVLATIQANQIAIEVAQARQAGGDNSLAVRQDLMRLRTGLTALRRAEMARGLVPSGTNRPGTSGRGRER